MSQLDQIAGQADAQQVLVSAVAQHIERMSKDELQSLVSEAQIRLHAENEALQIRIKELEEENAKLNARNEELMYEISRTLFSEEDYANFDPSEYTIPWETTLANVRQKLKKS